MPIYRPFPAPCSTGLPDPALSFHKAEVLIFLYAAPDDDGVPTHYPPRGRHTDGHHLENNLALESINPLYNILSRGYASGPHLLFMVICLRQMPDLTGKIPV